MNTQKFAFLKELSVQLQKSATVKTIYGEPIETQGKTLIPVGRVAYGLGGGYGRSSQSETAPTALPESGGGGVMVFPLGFYEVTRKGVRFIAPSPRPVRWISLLLAGVLVGVWFSRMCNHLVLSHTNEV